jgi:hypothetical protein
LHESYLKKDADGEYDRGYPTNPMQYDWAEGAEKKITIAESIGLIAELAAKTKPNLDQMKELTATLFKKQGLMTKVEAHKAFKSFNGDKIRGTFHQESKGLDVEEVYQQQQQFKLAKQLYVAATTYGDNSSACTQGTFTQIIAITEEIDSKISEQWGAYKEAERAKGGQNNITDDIIMLLVTACTKECLLKKDGAILTNPNLKDPIIDIATAMLDIKYPEQTMQPQQQVLSSINTYLIKHIKEYLQNYDRAVPKLDEYTSIIESFSKVPDMQRFAQNPDEYFYAPCTGEGAESTLDADTIF